jgi:hypothetical protein
MKVPRILRRMYWAHRVRAAQSEIAHLEHVRAHLGPALDRALRDSNAARLELWLVDFRRSSTTGVRGVGSRETVTDNLGDAA